MHSNPRLRSLALAAVVDLPTGTPLAELCPTVSVACPVCDRGRLSLGTLLGSLGWRPAPGTKPKLTVVAAAARGLRVRPLPR